MIKLLPFVVLLVFWLKVSVSYDVMPFLSINVIDIIVLTDFDLFVDTKNLFKFIQKFSFMDFQFEKVKFPQMARI